MQVTIIASCVTVRIFCTIVCPKSLKDNEEDRGSTRGNNACYLALLDRFYTTKFMGVGNIPEGAAFPQNFLGTYGKSP